MQNKSKSKSLVSRQSNLPAFPSGDSPLAVIASKVAQAAANIDVAYYEASVRTDVEMRLADLINKHGLLK